ncbi:MAG: TonB-dependent receptor [Sphingobacteriales bacterium]|nr:TonB-dependent receptor [Sphingobacteriales bacterium]
MRNHDYTCKFVFFILLFMGCSNFMNARSQTGTWLVSYAQVAAPPADPDQARAISSILSDARKTFDVDFIYESKILPDVKLVMDIDRFKHVEDFLTELLRPYNLKFRKMFTRAYVIYSNNTELKRLMTIVGHGESIPDEILHARGAKEIPPIVITGRIMDEKATPLEGVSVVIRGANRGTVTDKAGNFRLEVPDERSVLLISLIGYQTREVTVGSQTNFQLALVSQSQSLNDVVVVGYGTQKKSVVTGAISSVKSSDLENMPVYRLEQSLQGRTSGLTIAASSGQPGSSSTVRIRGTTSIGNSDPLYVVDGVPVDVGGIDYLNQSDIESIEVLKDAASAAIYGTRAASGVILVTTKKGKAGTMRLNYNGYYGTQAPARKLHLLNATQYATLRNESSIAGGGGILFPDPASLGKGTNWQDAIFSNSAKIQDHELSLSGGGDKSTYYGSFGYFDQTGIVASPISYYKRLTARFNATHKMKSWLTFGQNIGYSHIKAQGLGNTNGEYGGPLSSAINLDPLTPFVITDPAVLADPTKPYSSKPVIRDGQGRPYAISDYVGQEETNPLAYIKTQQGYGWSDNIVGDAYLEVEPIKGLKVRSDIGTKLAFWGSESFTPIYYLNGSSGNPITSFYRENNKGFTYNWENTASYTRSFGEHNFTVLVGTSAYKAMANGLNGTYKNMPVNNLNDASLSYSLANTNKIAGGFDDPDHTISSMFARLTYNFSEKYLFTGIVRRDGSSRFGSDHKYGYFPSASVGWVASREDFWPVNTAVTFLKIRGSYGVTGNDNIGDFKYVSTVSGGRNYTFGNNSYNIGYSPDAPANPALKWEQTSQANVGFDAVLFKDITVGFDVYNKKTKGILQTIQLPGYVGATGSPWGNVADMSNKGIELELGYTRKFGEVNVSARGNVSYLQNRVTNIGPQPYLDGAHLASTALELSRTMPGYAIGSFYGFKTLGIFQTQAEINNYLNKDGKMIQPNAKPGDFKWADITGDGQITNDDRTFIGDPTPKWAFGFTVSAAWKGFDILVFGQGAAGNQIYQGLRRLDIPKANYTTAALDRWTGPGTSNNFPRLIDGDPNGNFSRPSPFYLSNGSYMRIKTLQIGYNLPHNVTDRAGLQKVRVYVSGNNLVTFTKYTGFDPEIGGSSYGIDRGIYPQARSFTVGLNVGL